jgi:hypothetical protein
MQVHLFPRSNPEVRGTTGDHDIVRVEVPLVGPDERQWKVIVLDADDTFDVIIQEPNGDREGVWSLVKEGEQAGFSSTDDTEGVRGVCMNCGNEMDFNPMHPWCPDCDKDDEEEDDG